MESWSTDINGKIPIDFSEGNTFLNVYYHTIKLQNQFFYVYAISIT